MPQLDVSQIAIIVFAAAAFLVLLLLLRRLKRDGSSLSVENAALKDAVANKDAELRDAVKDAGQFGALAEERKTENSQLKDALSKLQRKLEEEGEKQQELSNTVSRLQTTLDAERAGADEKIAMLLKIRQGMETKFSELAQEALKVQGEAFSKSNLEKLAATLTPLKEHVGHFEKELKNVHEETLKDRERLKTEISQLSRRSEEISQEALALTRALKSDKQKQGAWGEMILDNILQISGLREGKEYESQAHRISAEGERLRPDVVVNMSGGKTLVIDSKVSLVAYVDAVAAESDAQAAEARKRHLASLRNHIDRLAGKGYQNAEDSTVDYVVMFVPIEGALSEALVEDNSIIGYAFERHVTIATPTTLMMALKMVANMWATERRDQNAEQIARRAGLIYDKVVGFVGNMEAVGKHLGKAQDAHQDAFRQLSRGRGNLLSQVENLKYLGATTNKEISVEFDDRGDEGNGHAQITDATPREEQSEAGLYQPAHL